MPIYEYKCQSCGERHEKIQKYTDPPCKKCPHCGGALKKMFSSPAIQFKGSGFYITDYAKKNSPSEEKKIKADPGKQAGWDHARRERAGAGQDRDPERSQARG
jgi:putative FmdB family regulatory protein